MIIVVRGLQELTWKKQIPLYVCFTDLTKAYDFVDQTLLWTVLARFGVPQNMISVIRQLHDGMRPCMRCLCFFLTRVTVDLIYGIRGTSGGILVTFLE